MTDRSDVDEPAVMAQALQLVVRTTEGDRKGSLYYVTSEDYAFLKGRTK